MFIGCGLYYMEKMRKARATVIGQIKSNEQKVASIKEMLTKASEMANTQQALRAQIEMPSMNAVHSRYKNGLVSELHDLEQKKLDLLNTVLGSGYDPMITAINEAGIKQEMLLSAYVKQAAGLLSTNQPTTPPVDPSQPRKAGKFMVYKGGKDDGRIH